MESTAAGPGPAAFLLAGKGRVEQVMGNAKKAALMAIFAAAEQREAEPLTLTQKTPPPWERAKRPIEVDLALLAERRRSRA
jgi:hypothetical protein